MKKSVLFSLTCVVLASSLYAAPKKLRVVGSWSSLSLYKEYEKPFWKKEFVKEFPGTKVRLSSLGQIKLKGAAVYRELSKGTFDVVSTVGDYVVSDSETIAGLDFPTMANDLTVAKKVVDAYKNTLDEALKKDFNAKLLAVVPYPAQVLFCKERITSLKDLKGKKVRASGWTVSSFLDGVGATGITMSFGEVPQALQRGVIDCAVTGGLSGYSAGWGEVSNYLYPLQIGGWDYVVTAMNLDTWNSFSKDEQTKLLASINTNIITPAWVKTNYETKEGEKCLTGQDCSYGKPNKMKLVKVKDADEDLSKEVLINNVIPQWTKKVSPEVVKEWNDSIGKIVNITAK
ncbi:Extracellular solute-binding protein, family 7 [Arcobacter nitrofigilis DSM 7299]|uniref:Extracellular solute-binding protein, family 7 n=1 Tax=Arcobacter nitrofigilis (strain ATCC 33309 / DSM 7299 / CCUG 15893 / LMG 7604 / NCTC 12251 / CI) TaxID=572480 RepID=D5V4N9_ARCNC|nr:TRAP transporter substrate-binding protein [Arcobacter nitrofigilis]ADG92944.1 Extracellular solute-binding protein, family 7 [Arcobacter nitrofigilis DSM 7299]